MSKSPTLTSTNWQAQQALAHLFGLKTVHHKCIFCLLLKEENQLNVRKTPREMISFQNFLTLSLFESNDYILRCVARSYCVRPGQITMAMDIKESEVAKSDFRRGT